MADQVQTREVLPKEVLPPGFTPVEELRDWEVIQKNQFETTERLAVHSGFLYRNRTSGGGVALVFVPK